MHVFKHYNKVLVGTKRKAGCFVGGVKKEGERDNVVEEARDGVKGRQMECGNGEKNRHGANKRLREKRGRC